MGGLMALLVLRYGGATAAFYAFPLLAALFSAFMMAYARKAVGAYAICYLRVRLEGGGYEALRERVERVLRERLPEVGPSHSAAEPGAAWADVEHKVSIFLWPSKAGGDPVLELRSNAGAARLASFKGAVVEALYG